MSHFQEQFQTGRHQLGKQPASYDKRNFKLSKYVLAPPPPLADWLKLPSWPMYDNDTLSDCVEAAAGHMIGAWQSYSHPTAPAPTAAQIVQAYSGATGYNPYKPWTDNGTNLLSFLKYWRKIGIAGHKILAFMAIQPGNLAELQQSIWLTGAAMIGVALPLSAQGESQWTVPNGLRGDNAPGSWGGHCVPVGAYNDHVAAMDRNTVVTWGATLTMSDYFYQCYSDEAYAVLSQDWIDAKGLAPNQFDLKTLQADLAAL